jgi:two-component system chemotaxis response regulator CheY
MDGMGFIEAFQCIAEEKEGERVVKPPVIFCTTENTLPKIQAAIDAGAAEYIMKPFTFDIVHEKLVTIGLIPVQNES